MKDGECVMSKEVQLSIRMTFGERLEAKMMAEALGLTLDGLVKEALQQQYIKNASLYDQIHDWMADRANSFISKNISKKVRKRQR